MDPNQPLGTVEIASLTGIPVTTISQWHRRGHLKAPRWIVSGRPAWSYADVVELLRAVPLHDAYGKGWERCGGTHTCPYCHDGHRSFPASDLIPLPASV